MKMMILFRRREDLTQAAFRDYYEKRHAPLALRLFPYLRNYRRNYIRRDRRHQRAGGEALASLDFDVITEIEFEKESDYQRMVDDMSDPDIYRQVVEDEEQFLDRTATVVFLIDET